MLCRPDQPAQHRPRPRQIHHDSPGARLRELQRDPQRELTYAGLRAAEAKGNKGGHRPADTAAKAAAVHATHLGDHPIATLARIHHVTQDAIRTALADLTPEHTTGHQDTPAPQTPVLLDIPGKVTDSLRTADLDPTERAALDQGMTARRGQGYTHRVNAASPVHRQLLARRHPLGVSRAHG